MAGVSCIQLCNSNLSCSNPVAALHNRRAGSLQSFHILNTSQTAAKPSLHCLNNIVFPLLCWFATLTCCVPPSPIVTCIQHVPCTLVLSAKVRSRYAQHFNMTTHAVSNVQARSPGVQVHSLDASTLYAQQQQRSSAWWQVSAAIQLCNIEFGCSNPVAVLSSCRLGSLQSSHTSTSADVMHNHQ